jgi:hypothetical protein
VTEPRFIALNVEDLAEIDGQVLRRRWEVVEGPLDGAILNLDWHVMDQVTGQIVSSCPSQEAAEESATNLSCAFPDGLPVVP